MPFLNTPDSSRPFPGFAGFFFGRGSSTRNALNFMSTSVTSTLETEEVPASEKQELMKLVKETVRELGAQ